MHKQNNYFFASKLSFLSIFIIILLYSFQSFSKELINYYSFIPTFIAYIYSLLYINSIYKIKNNILSTPSAIFLIIFGIYTIGGTLQHIIYNLSFREYLYNESLTETNTIIFFSFISWLTGYFFTNIIYKPKINNYIKWDYTKLNKIVLFLFLISTIAFIIFISKINFIPLIQGISPNVDEGLREEILDYANTPSVIYTNGYTVCIIILATLMSGSNQRYYYYLLYFLCFVPFILMGGRIYIVIPLLVSSMIYLQKKQFSSRRMILFSLILFVLFSSYSVIRNRNSFIYTNTSLSNNHLDSINIFPEYRDLLGTVLYKELLQKNYSPYLFYKGIYSGILPGKVLELAGINKKALHTDNEGSGWIIASLTRNYKKVYTGIRPGIIGQSLMAFDPWHVYLLFLLLGSFFNFLDKNVFILNINDSRIVLYSILTVLLSYLIVSTTQSVFSKFWYYIYAYIFIRITSSYRAF